MQRRKIMNNKEELNVMTRSLKTDYLKYDWQVVVTNTFIATHKIKEIRKEDMTLIKIKVIELSKTIKNEIELDILIQIFIWLNENDVPK